MLVQHDLLLNSLNGPELICLLWNLVFRFCIWKCTPLSKQVVKCLNLFYLSRFNGKFSGCSHTSGLYELQQTERKTHFVAFFYIWLKDGGWRSVISVFTKSSKDKKICSQVTPSVPNIQISKVHICGTPAKDLQESSEPVSWCLHQCILYHMVTNRTQNRRTYLQFNCGAGTRLWIVWRALRLQT